MKQKKFNYMIKKQKKKINIYGIFLQLYCIIVCVKQKPEIKKQTKKKRKRFSSIIKN